MKKIIKLVVFFLISAIVGAIMGATLINKSKGERLNDCKSLSDKHLRLFLMMNQWVKVKQKGKQLAEFFMMNDYQKIAIYGMSYVGETLVEELKGTSVEVLYGIDRSESVFKSGIKIVSVHGNLEEVDAVVVTAVTFFDEIEEMLCDKIACPVISLEDILYDL